MQNSTKNRRSRKINATILNEHEIDDFLIFIKHEYEKKLTKRKLTDFIRNKERDLAIISMLLGSGVRVSEIASLTLPDIDFQKNKIDIIRKGNKQDTARVLPAALEDLKTYLLKKRKKFYRFVNISPSVYHFMNYGSGENVYAKLN